VKKMRKFVGEVSALRKDSLATKEILCLISCFWSLNE